MSTIWWNEVKLVANCRTGNLDPNCTTAKGNKFQELTVIWRSIVSSIIVEDLNKKLDCYNTPIDHSLDSELGIIQTKGRLYDHLERRWDQSFKSEHKQIANGLKFDTVILYCASKDGKIIERIYIFPTAKILERMTISIYKNPMNRHGTGPIVPWYEEYRVTDKKTLELVNKIWKYIIDA